MRTHTQQLRSSINCKRSPRARVLSIGFRLIATHAILIAVAAPAQVVPTPQDTNSALFLPVVTYGSGGGGAQSLAVADLNGDGVPDLAIANIYSSTVDILLGNGDGTFQAAVTYSSGGYSTASVVIADANGDGKPDLLVANYCGNQSSCNGSDGSVGVLLGNGDGTFKPAAVYASGGSFPVSLAVADVDLDLKPDLVVANNGSNSVAILLGNGDGSFRPGATYSSPNAFKVGIADVNGDGKPDVLMANLYDNVFVLLGNGDGTFQPAAVYNPGGFDASSVVARDVNGDGKPDLLVTNWFVNNHNFKADGVVGVLLGNGDGTFQPAVTYDSGGQSPSSIAVADVNGDGNPDLVVENCSSSGGNDNCSPGNGIIAVLLGNGHGTFQRAATFSSGGSTPQSIAIADVNGDGEPDLLVANLCASTCPDLFGSVGVILHKSTTSTSLISSLNPSIYGQTVTWTATISTSSSITPTGKVTFKWSDFTIGSATLNNGVATLTKSNLNADPYPLTAVYAGDANNLPSTSAILNQVILETTSTATLNSLPNPSTRGQAVTFTARISSPTVVPTGPVTFTAGKTVLGTAQLSGGKAKLAISSLPVGSTKVTATYNGDSNIAKSSASVIQTVQ